ncbi:MAG: N-acetylmuramoyl-L-alanine amidase [Alphaproteobacteria bacterium]|nr:N-acetylmuramoyl-L-alanine amidase [Alphaproteobacteria bacterium]
MKKQNIDAIVIHCTASRAGQDLRAADIDKMHQERGFAMIGYNYVVDLDGTVEDGRPLSRDGAHCNTAGLSGKSYNKHSIGIVYVGGLDENGKPADTRTPEQKRALADLVYRLINEYPIVEVIGHRDASPDKNGNGKIERNEWIKQCPCFSVRDEFPMAVCVAKKKQ